VERPPQGRVGFAAPPPESRKDWKWHLSPSSLELEEVADGGRWGPATRKRNGLVGVGETSFPTFPGQPLMSKLTAW
jgi:hypothetical protein